MPDRRRHRGPHPADHALFAAALHPRLRDAVRDLSWLLTRGYAPAAALKLVGDRFRLRARQRQAVGRCACADDARAHRAAHRLAPAAAAGASFDIDGFNLLTTVEAALAGGVLLVGRDDCCRDLAGVHGSYRKVAESEPALRLIGQTLADLGARACRWLFDRPVSNSGRLCAMVQDLARQAGWPWRCETVDSPDALLRDSPAVVVTADSVILDACERWLNLADHIVRRRLPQAWVVDLR